MPFLRSSASRLVLALLGAGLASPALMPATAQAASFDVPPAAGAQTVSGTDQGNIAAGATLNGAGAPGIQWNGVATGTGVVITNLGTVTANTRAIDTTSGVSGAFTLDNRPTGEVKSADDAFRINGTLANGSVTVKNAGTIKSTNGQALDFDKANAATAVVGITNSGTISSAGSDAIRLGGGTIEVTNSGTIESTAKDKRAIKFDSAANFDTLKSFTLTNTASGVITGTDDGIKISSTTSSTAAPVISITNSGTIQSKGIFESGVMVDGGQAIDLGDISSPNAKITITNNKGGTITAAANDAIQGATGLTVNNSGTISSYYAPGTQDTQNNSAIKIDGEGIAGGRSMTVNNDADGVIDGAYHGIKASGAEDFITVTNSGTIKGRNGSGVNSNGSGLVTNYGTITGTYDPTAAFGDGDGIDFDHAGTVYNYGTIKGLGSKGTKPGESAPSTSEAIAIGGGLIVNGDAAHTSALISGANNGILADDSNKGDLFEALSVTNYGTIEGLDGAGIRITNTAGTFGNTIVNYGKITGTTFAVATGNGDDTFVYEAGSSVTGKVYAEGGTDTFKLGEKDGTFNAALLGPSATYQDFEILTLATGSAWTLTGTSAFAGATNVTAATLVLDGASLAGSAFTVAGAGDVAGGLYGSGTVGGLAVASGGVVSPGKTAGEIGTFTVNGNASFAAGSAYLVDAPVGTAIDHIQAGGTATIADGAVVAADFSANTYVWGQSYAIVTATGGVSGNFTLDAYNVPAYLFLTPDVTTDANNVYLILDRNGVPFTAFAATRNQLSVAGALDRTGPGGALEQPSRLYDALVYSTNPATVATAFTQLSGDIYPTLSGVLFTENTLVNDTLLGRVRQAGYAAAPGAAQALGYGGPVAAYADPAPAKAGPFKAVKAPAPGPVWSAWVQGYGQWLDVDANAGAGVAKADSSVGGVLAGADVTLNNYVFGLAAGYSSSSTNSGASSADTDTWRIAAYGGASFDALKLRAGATYAWSSIDASRFVALTGELPQASYDATAANVFAEAGYTVALGPVALEPFAGIGWTGIDQNGFVETLAPIAGLVSPGSSFDTAYTTLGLRAAATYSLSGFTVTPHASAGWRHAFGDVTPTSTLAFLETGSAFGVEGLAIAQDALVASAGLDVVLGGGFTLGLTYDGQFGDGVTYNAGRAVLSARF